MNAETHEARRRLARHLRALRLQRGLTQAELGQRMGFAYPSSISVIENARRPIYQEDLAELAKALGCDPDELIPEPKDEAANYPTRRSRWRLLTLAVLSLSNLAATDLYAEDDVDKPRKPSSFTLFSHTLIPQLSEDDVG